jgi:uncharacterized protein YdiU (UPF0061 family)
VTIKKNSDAGWCFDNTFTHLPEVFFSPTKPEPVRHAGPILLNETLAEGLGLNVEILRLDGRQVFAGNEIPSGAMPIAQAYAGHQFGHFTNLGDGRAILLGEHLTPNKQRVDVQLKGSGRTPYSRSGDGRAALGPMIREYIISEGMESLGIPTTRSLSVTATGESVLRSSPLPGAILTRVAKSHIRVGTFQYAAALGGKENLSQLLGYTVDRHYPELGNSDDLPFTFLQAVLDRQADLVSRWMLVGFVHGVMNTDNVSIAGETIDYGPCAFLDVYHPETVFSSIDHQGRYAFQNQPSITQWNLARLAESLVQVVPGNPEDAIGKFVEILETFPSCYEKYFRIGANAKIGLTTLEKEDSLIYSDLLKIMEESQLDFTETFVTLADGIEQSEMKPEFSKVVGLSDWIERWSKRLAREPGSVGDAAKRMQAVNPVIIPRNLKVEEALVAAESGDLGPTHCVLEALKSPFSKTKENEPYQKGALPGSQPYCTFCGT